MIERSVGSREERLAKDPLKLSQDCNIHLAVFADLPDT